MERDSCTAAKTIRQVVETYDEIACTYHAKRFLSARGQYDLYESRAVIRRIIRRFADIPDDNWRALDVGSGSGRVALAVAEKGKVIALDTSEKMLATCAEQARIVGLESRVSCIHASAESIPHPDSSFDMVFSFRFLHLFPPAYHLLFLREMVRVTKPGGYLVIEFINPHYGVLADRLRNSNAVRATHRSGRQIQELARTMNVDLCDMPGLLLPKGYLVRNIRPLSGLVRWLAYYPFRSIAFSRVAIFRKLSGSEVAPR